MAGDVVEARYDLIHQAEVDLTQSQGIDALRINIEFPVFREHLGSALQRVRAFA